MESLFHKYYFLYKAQDVFERADDDQLAVIFEAMSKHNMIVLNRHPVADKLAEKVFRRLLSPEFRFDGFAADQLLNYLSMSKWVVRTEEHFRLWFSVAERMAEADTPFRLNLMLATLAPSANTVPETFVSLFMNQCKLALDSGDTVDVNLCLRAADLFYPGGWLPEDLKLSLSQLLHSFLLKQSQEKTSAASMKLLVRTATRLAYAGVWSNDVTTSMLAHPALSVSMKGGVENQLCPELHFNRDPEKIRLAHSVRHLAFFTHTFHASEYTGPMIGYPNSHRSYLLQDMNSRQFDEGELWGFESRYMTACLVGALRQRGLGDRIHVCRVVPHLGLHDVLVAVRGGQLCQIRQEPDDKYDGTVFQVYKFRIQIFFLDCIKIN